MASAVGTKRKAATIARVVKFDRGCAKSVPEAEGWAAKWGAKLKALTLPTTGVGEDYRAESMRSPRGGLVVDTDGSMRRQLMNDINEKRTQRNTLLLEMWNSERLPLYMSEEDRQHRNRIDRFRKLRLTEGREYDPALIPPKSDQCAFCDEKHVPLKDMGIVDYRWGCGRCRGERHDHTVRDEVRAAVDLQIKTMMSITRGDTHNIMEDIASMRNRLKATALTNKARRTSSSEGARRGKGAEETAFNVIFGTPFVNKKVDASVSFAELPDLQAYEDRLLINVTKQHQTVFADKNLDAIIAVSVARRQNTYLRKMDDDDHTRVSADYAIQLWKQQGGVCARCRERLFWNWAVGGRAGLAQLDRVDVTVMTYVDNYAWLCQACNRHKGMTEDILAYDRHLWGALDRAVVLVGSGECDMAADTLKHALKLQLTRQSLQ
jgi:hypothetical protein